MQLLTLGERARSLLESQRSQVRTFGADLTYQVGELLTLVNREREQLLAQIEELKRQPDSQGEAEDEDAGALLHEAQIALREALSHQQQLRSELKRRSEQVAILEQELDGVRQDCPQQIQNLDAAHEGFAKERAELQELLQDLERQLEEAKRENADSSEGSSSEMSEAAPAPPREPAGGFDWETQKQLLMQQMDEDFDDSEQGQRDRLTVEGAIRITDQVVAEKEEEIRELRHLLEQQSGNIGNVAVGAAAIAEFLDQDELIAQERENLVRLQEEWREKLRKTEVEISLDRAKLARERVEFEEKIRTLEARSEDSESDEDNASQKAPKRKWLSRLGIKESDEG